MLSVHESVFHLYEIDHEINKLVETSQKLKELQEKYPGQFDFDFYSTTTIHSKDPNNFCVAIIPKYNGKRLTSLPLFRLSVMAYVNLGTGEIAYREDSYDSCATSHEMTKWEGGAYLEGSRERITYDDLQTFWEERIKEIETIFNPGKES